MNLTSKISVLGILVIIVIVASLLIVGIRTSNSELEEQIGELQVTYTEALMHDIDVLVYQATQDIELMSEDEEIEGFVSGYQDNIESKDKLKEWQFLTGPWYFLEVYNLEGEVILSLEDSGEYIDEHHDEIETNIINEVIQTEAIYYSDALISEENGKLTQIFVAPIRNEELSSAPVVGVIAGKFAWEVVEEVLQKSGRNMHLYNADGLLIASSDYHQDQYYLQSSLENINLHRLHLEDDKESLVVYSQHHDEKVLISHVVSDGYLSYEGLQWILVLEEPVDEAFAATQALSKNLLTAGLLVAILGIIVFFVATQKLTEPILDLKDKADKISKGNLGETIKIKTGDEIEELADSFDNMRYSLKMVIDEYEEKLSKVKPKNEKRDKSEK